MNMIENHMEQVALSSATIADLPFPPPKIFTNALLSSSDITALIRDTEAHERALFTFVSPETGPSNPRRHTSLFQANGEGPGPGSTGSSKIRPTTAAGRILGGDLLRQIRRENKDEDTGKTEVDVEVLLKSAERLCAVYPISGAVEKIALLRARHTDVAESIHKYESIVSDQASQLSQMNQNRDDDDLDDCGFSGKYGGKMEVNYTIRDLHREEEELRQLEEKKRAVEERLQGVERDIGGLRR